MEEEEGNNYVKVLGKFRPVIEHFISKHIENLIQELNHIPFSIEPQLFQVILLKFLKRKFLILFFLIRFLYGFYYECQILILNHYSNGSCNKFKYRVSHCGVPAFYHHKFRVFELINLKDMSFHENSCVFWNPREEVQ